jgi:hypothetical protein
LLLANENAVTNIADLWVAAAMNVDNDDPFESDAEEDEAEGEETNQDEPLATTADGDEGATEMNGTSFPILRGSRSGGIPTPIARLSRTSHRLSTTNSLHPASSLRHASPLPNRTNPIPFSPMIPSSPRRLSMNVPSIFAHPGVKTPPAVLDAQQLLLSTDIDHIVVPSPDALGTITESRPHSQSQADVESLALTEKPPSLMSQLPIVVIIQYGVMALHTTTHDQIFMSYLVS